MNQIKNIVQKEEEEKSNKNEKYSKVTSFDELVNLCILKREMNLKYELETNVSLVKFEKNRIEIAFNENLNKNFIKDLSVKLLEWTNQRWIITLTQEKGEITLKENIKKIKDEVLLNYKNSKNYEDIIKIFDDLVLKKIEKK